VDADGTIDGHAPRQELSLNADPATQLRLLDLQALDSRLAVLSHRRASHPDAAQAAALIDRRGEMRDAVVRAETERSDIEREQNKADADVEQVRARAARDRQRMDAGQVGSPRELEGLQHELESLARRQSELEDVELAIMERLEAVQQRLVALAAEQAENESAHAAVTTRLDEAYAEIDREAAGLAEERAALVAGIPADLLTVYDKLRAQHGGVGAAALRARRCEGCRLELEQTELARIRSAPEDEVLRCEECRRILVRTVESGL
jgi:predicted  nucleic acid-binding Zn-ribbon protein